MCFDRENTDIFGRIIPKSKKRKLNASHHKDQGNVMLDKIKTKLNNTNKNRVNTIQQKLEQLAQTQLEQESKLDGLDKNNVINWERKSMKEIDFKFDERQAKQDSMNNIVEQTESMNNRHAIIESINDSNDHEISSKINIDDKLITNNVDKKHFDAIFSKPKMVRNDNECKDKNEQTGKKTAKHDLNETIDANNKSKTNKKKKSWRQRIKKYQ